MTTETSNARGEWVLVPRVPTEAMLDAVCSAEGIEPWTDEIMRQTYIAMLDAAPPPAAARGDVRGLVLSADEREWLECAIEHMRDDSEPQDLTCADALEALLQRALAAEGVQAGEVADAEVWLFKGTDGAWHTFLNERHRLDTIADGGWDVRKFTALSQQPEAQKRKVGCEGGDGLLRVHEESETCDVCSPAKPEARGVVDEAMVDLRAHRTSWRCAIKLAITNAPTATEDTDDAAYWRHELRAFDRAFAALTGERNG